MNRFLKSAMLMLMLAGLISGCSFSDENKGPVDINDLQIADDFNFETERWINVELHALYTGTFYLKDMKDNMLYKGTIYQYEGFVQKIKLPTRITEVKIEYYEVENLTKNYQIRDNKIIYSFVPQIR